MQPPQVIAPSPTLRARIADLPLVLAGPIVRRVDATSAAIWIAASDPRRVTLRVFAATDATTIATATVDSTALGEHLHVAVVVAHGHFEWGQLYTYNLDFAPLTSSTTSAAGDLFAPGILSPPSAGDQATERAHQLLTYASCCPGAPALPSFPLPPEDLNQVRLIHGSCRIPHAESLDALPGVDDLIAHVAAQPHARPQQLFLTGDQIYANNIAPELLPAITEAGDTILGWRELLPGVEAYPEDYPPWTREEVVRDYAGLLEWGDASHLLGLGELYTLYLLNWSEVLWPDSFAQSPRGRRMQRFVASLGKVRRALANLPTYMIFDDHEVTDDWYLTLEWCRSVLGKPLGRRLVMNALAAYAVFQAWGNTPDQFADADADVDADSDSDRRPPGRRLLDALTRWRGLGDGDADIERLLGIPAVADITAHDPPQLVAPAGAIDWFYRVTTPGYEVLVLDGRTQRAYPGASEVDRPALLSDAAMAPDWHYRVDFLTADPGRADGHDLHPAEIAAATAKQQARMARTGHATEIVGRNHFAEIRLRWRDGARAAEQILWWRPTDDSPLLPLTSFTSSLELDDPAHPRPELHCEAPQTHRR